MLSLPVKLEVPSEDGGVAMLGLGDIVVPGLLVSYLLRYDRQRLDALPRRGIRSPGVKCPASYFQVAFGAYCVSLAIAVWISATFDAAQPALIYLIPGTLGSTFIQVGRRQTHLHPHPHPPLWHDMQP